MPAPAMLIWKTQEQPTALYTVQQPTGAIEVGLSLGQVRKLALSNKWAVEYPDTTPPAAGPAAAPSGPPVGPPT